MRAAVKKPSAKKAPGAIVQPTINNRTNHVSSKRLFRAKTVLRSPRIGHFKPKADGLAKEGEIINRTAAAKAGTMPGRALARPASSLITSLPGSQLERMLDHALARADAHKKALKSRGSGPLRYFRRLPLWLTATIILVTVVLVGGMFVWQNVPSLSLKVASSRAHVDAGTPSYIPEGFALASPVRYQSGAVQFEIKSTVDSDKSLTISQQKSNLDSESLKEKVVPKSTPIQTSDVNGSPLYIYGKSNDAVFKKGDTQVIFSNNANLPPNELSNIAKSMQ